MEPFPLIAAIMILLALIFLFFIIAIILMMPGATLRAWFSINKRSIAKERRKRRIKAGLRLYECPVKQTILGRQRIAN